MLFICYNAYMKFIKKHKKSIIISSIVLTILLVLIILIFTLFSLKNVELEFKTETSELSSSEVQQAIIDKTMEYKGSVLFINKNRIVTELEKEFPYIKVVNIETKAPDTFVIHCAEREKFYGIESNGKVFYLDEDLKILEVVDGDFVYDNQAVLLTLEELSFNNDGKLEVSGELELNLGNAEAGQFLNLGNNGKTLADVLSNNMQNTLTNLLTAFEENNRDIAVVKGTYSKFEVFFKAETAGENTEWHTCLRIIDNTDFETQIINSESRLSEKLEAMINTVGIMATNNPEELLDNKIVVFENITNNIEVRKIALS